MELRQRRQRIVQRIHETTRDVRAESIFLNFNNTPTSSTLLTHRIQAWEIHDRKAAFPPDISDPLANLVVREAKIHNETGSRPPSSTCFSRDTATASRSMRSWDSVTFSESSRSGLSDSCIGIRKD